jgi:hypothetical protein
LRHRQRFRWLCSALALTLGAAAAEARADDAGPEADRLGAALRVESPRPGERLTHGVPWLLVRGHARAELFDADVVIALDVSNSALLASGLDLDGDGVVGETLAWAEDEQRKQKRPPAWTTDAEDSIAEAERIASRALVDGLAWRRNRIGLIRYTARPRELAAIGDPERVRQALALLSPVEDWSGTDVGRVLRFAARMLERATPPGEAPRPRAVLLCSDGEPSVPSPSHHAKQRALREAERLARAGIALTVLGFGAELLSGEDPEPREFLEALARAGQGELVRVSSPATLLQDLPPARPAPDSLEVVNRSTGAPAQALRRVPDGSFDALLPLAVGPNELEVRAEWADGRRERVRRSVRFEPSAEPDAEQRRTDADLLTRLRARSVEMQETAP